MKFFKLEPEVAGGLGQKTLMDTTVHPPSVSILEYQFDGWLGDDLLESFPCYIVTEKLKNLVQENSFAGYKFDDVIISTSDTFKELYPETDLPKFYWLKIDGKAGIDDVGFSESNYLIVSEIFLTTLLKVNLKNCLVEEYQSNPHT
jgi:hypothetical protein